MKTSFGYAKTLFDRNTHPRLFIGPDDVSRLKRCIHSGAGRKVMDVIRRRTEPFIESALAVDDLAGYLAGKETYQQGADIFGAMHDIALIALLDGNPRALETARRMLVSLPDACPNFHYDIFVHGRIFYSLLAWDLLYHQLSRGDRDKFMHWALETQVADIIRDRRPTVYKRAGVNLEYGKILPAILMVLAFRHEPGAPPLDDSLKEMISFFEAVINTAISSDGYPEEDTGYGTDFLCFIFRTAEALRRAGEFDALKTCPRLAESGRALLQIVEPWGDRLVTTGDAGDHFWGRQHVLPRLAAETKDPALLWLLGKLRYETDDVEFAPGFRVPADAMTLMVLEDLKRPVSPEKARVPLAFRDRRRGIVSFRSGWRADDTLVVFDGAQRSPGAQGHFHASGGHFSLSALGEYFAVDTGRYNMDQDQHNLVLVDGKSGHPSHGQWVQTYQDGLLIDYQPAAFCDFAAVDSSHQHDCYWARRYLGLVKGRGLPAYIWIVEDINPPRRTNDVREFWWSLNTSPENTIELRGQSAAIRGWRHGNFLDVHFALPDPKAYPQPHTLTLAQDIQAGGSFKYLDAHETAKKFKQPRDMLYHSIYERPRVMAKVSGWNGRFMSVLLPRRKDEQPLMVERLPSVDNSLAVSIASESVVDTVIFAYEHQLLEAVPTLEEAGISGRGQWCVVRRARKSGKALAWTLGNGTRLSVGGRNLPVEV
ncbi:MAG: heparinase II/III family protein [Lentisphaerae bacterium]|nr:heparinase II/III family protein [Lentisphaerota bacterium]